MYIELLFVHNLTYSMSILTVDSYFLNSQLKSKAPNHALVTSLATFHSAFDRVAATLN